MEGKRNWSDSLAHCQSKKIKTINQIETPADGEIPNLPGEIIIEILKRLPVKSLLKFRCVSKSWRSLISNSEFIKTHLKYSTNNAIFTSHRIMFTLSNPRYNLKHCSVQSLMFEPLAVASDIVYPKKSPRSAVWIVGSCNGLICIGINEKGIYLWNPSTRTSKKLPPAPVKTKRGFYYVWGFGFNESDDDYKVVGIFSVFGNAGVFESLVKIYSLKTNSWKRIEDFKGGIPLDDSGKFASGKLHFSTIPGIDLGMKWNIVSLDLKSEVYGTVEQPNYGEGNFESSLGVLGGCICVLCNYPKTRADVWILKEYNKQSWTKVVTIPYINDPGKCFYSNPLLMLPNGEILLVFGMHFVVYNPKDNSFRRPETSNAYRFLKADIYIESLVSLQVEG